MIRTRTTFPPVFTKTFANTFGDQLVKQISGDTLVNDTFTEAGDTVLSSHVPDTGTGWTQEFNNTVGPLVVNVIGASDFVKISGTDGVANPRIIYTAQPDPTDPEYFVQGQVTTVDFSGTDKWFLVARYQDSSNFYCYGGSSGDGSPNSAIYKVVAGVRTVLINDTVNRLINGSTLKFEVLGNKLNGYFDGTLAVTINDSSFPLAGKGGMGWGALGVAGDNVVANWEIDNFLMVD